MTVHWSYRALRLIAYIGLGVMFWAWLIVLALSGKV